jgi:nucleoside-diphosphate-sugar epimerase
MQVIVFGASGMVGQGVLRECLVADDVESVLSVVRRPTGVQHAKLTELVHTDFTDFSTAKEQLTGYDACFFCLGVSSVGMKEPEYARITYDFTLAAARMLAAVNPGSTFVYVSGAEKDSPEQRRWMWARGKGYATAGWVVSECRHL